MSINRPQEVLDLIKAQLAVINTRAGYATDIGTRIFLFEAQRQATQRPSIALGTRGGTLDRSGETGADGRKLSPRSRSMEFVIEAAVSAGASTSQEAALDMLEDIERAWAIKPVGSPVGLLQARLSTWSILDRPEGIDATVLQIVGTAEYVRP